MDHLADRLDSAADALTTVDKTLPHLAVAEEAFAAGRTGGPGRLGRDLHAHWSAVLTARAHEAAAAATRLTTMAASVRAAREHYTTTDEAAAARFDLANSHDASPVRQDR
jgi:hypothetical protein